MTHESQLESAPAYALGALDEAERASFEAHLAACGECRAEVDAFREVVGVLAYAAPAARPPNEAALRERILREARKVRPLARARSRGGYAAPAGWTAAAACLALAALGGLGLQRERGRIAELERELVAARAELAGRDSLLAAFSGPEVHAVSLAAPTRQPSARVFWNHTRQVFIITAFDLPPAPEGKTYQLWAIAKGKAPISMGTFETDDRGHATTIVAVGATVLGAGFIDYCALTLEPDGGSPQPTESPRLIGTWRHVD